MADSLIVGWREVVLAEAAVAYAYAVAGPLLGDPQVDEAATIYHDHERARDNALVAMTATGESPVAIPAFYALPDTLETPDQARGLLATVESRLAVTYADLVAVLSATQREAAVDGVVTATVRAMRWGASPGPWGAGEPTA